jgi:hypothetical protein
MNQSGTKLPKSVFGAFVVLLILGVIVTYLKKSNDIEPEQDPTPAEENEDEDIVVVDTPPDIATLSETRKEGSTFSCTVVGRIEGTMNQKTELEIYHPVFQGDIKSAWLAPWTTRFTAEVLENDGSTILERRTFEEVRSVELMAPAELTELTYDLDPKVNTAISVLASRLEKIYPGNPYSKTMSSLIKSQDFNYSEVAKLTGIDEKILGSKEAAVAGAAKILDDFEGKTVEVELSDGRAQWIYAPDIPKRVSQALGRVNSLIDYSAIPNPGIEVGGKVILSDLLMNEMLPPELMKEILGEYETRLMLELVRTEDENKGGRTFNRFDGDGTLTLRTLDGNVYTRLALDSAEIRVDSTDSSNRYLHQMKFSGPIDSQILQSNSRLKEVKWEGDLKLTVRYEVELVR